MAWIIDIDHIADPRARPGTNQNAVGVMGPSTYRGDGGELTHRFRVLDDGGELYYEGRSGEEDFGPLEDFGTPNAGATTIRYLVAGTWRDL